MTTARLREYLGLTTLLSTASYILYATMVYAWPHRDLFWLLVSVSVVVPAGLAATGLLKDWPSSIEELVKNIPNYISWFVPATTETWPRLFLLIIAASLTSKLTHIYVIQRMSNISLICDSTFTKAHLFDAHNSPTLDCGSTNVSIWHPSATFADLFVRAKCLPAPLSANINPTIIPDAPGLVACHIPAMRERFDFEHSPTQYATLNPECEPSATGDYSYDGNPDAIRDCFGENEGDEVKDVFAYEGDLSARNEPGITKHVAWWWTNSDPTTWKGEPRCACVTLPDHRPSQTKVPRGGFASIQQAKSVYYAEELAEWNNTRQQRLHEGARTGTESAPKYHLLAARLLSHLGTGTRPDGNGMVTIDFPPEYPDPIPAFVGENLKLPDIHFVNARFDGLSLEGADLHNTIFEATDISGLSLKGANLQNTDLSQATGNPASWDDVVWCRHTKWPNERVPAGVGPRAACAGHER